VIAERDEVSTPAGRISGEIEVALVMRRTAEDRAGAVVHQDEVGDVDRQFPRRVERVAAVSPVSKPSFSAFSIASSVVPPLRAIGAEGGDLGVVGAPARLASGWSGEMPTKDAPSSVSGRVV
jgi:hypothetical protein